MPFLDIAENVLKPYPVFSTVVSALLVAFLIWTANEIRKKMTAANKSQIDIEYWRLFGPSTTRVMELLDSDPEVIMQDDYPSHTRICLPNGEDIVEKDFWRAYCSIVRKRKFITCRRWLWEKYSGNKDLGTKVDFLARPPTDYEINSWLEDNYIDQSGEIEREHIDTSDRNFGWQPAENDVGFLFMNLKNCSKISLSNVQVTFRRAVIADRLPQVEPPDRWLYSEIKAQFELKGHPDTYLIQDPLQFGETVSFTVAKWEPGLQIAFLLAIYRSDGEGFENGYLDDVYELDSIQTKRFGNLKRWPVRRPLRQGSLREKIPYGWFRQ